MKYAASIVTVVSLVGLIATTGCSTTGSTSSAPAKATAAAPNTLTAAEKAAGWKLLWDGQTYTGWHVYRKQEAPSVGWEIKDGTLHALPKVKGTEIITEKKYYDFELTWDWKISEAGNNGIKYLVTEDENRKSAPGPEYQMLDDEKHEDGKRGPTHQTAAFYDVLPPKPDKPLLPVGKWNHSRLLIKGNHVEHWLNGAKVVEYELGSPEVLAAVAKSKFKSAPGFGTKIAGHIMLTYHQDECWYRNIKIHEL